MLVTQKLLRGIVGIIVSLIICQKGDTYALSKQSIPIQYDNNHYIRYQQKSQIELRYGVSTGFLYWKTSAYSEYWGEIVSELSYPIRRNVLSLSGKYNFTPQFSVNLSYELGKLVQEISIDTDWLLSISQDPWMKTRQPFYGQTHLSSIRIYYGTLENGNPGSKLSVFFGYHVYKLFIRIIDPVTYEIIQYEPVNETVRVGLDSTYEIVHEGLKYGLEGKFPFSPQIYLRGNLGYSPYLTIKANGYWNLRDMALIQSGTGNGLEGGISLNYSPTPSWQIALTYRYVVFNLKEGNFMNKFPGGTTAYGNWDSAQGMDKTIFISGTYRF